MQKTAAIHHPDAAARFFFRKPFGDEGRAEVVRNSGACSTSAEKNDLLIAERRPRHANGGKDRAERNGGGALNVVIEGEHLIAIAIKNGTSVNARKVFPLKQGRGKNLLDGRNEAVDETVIVISSDACMAPPKIFRVAKTLFVVGADVQNDGKRARGMDSADKTVERKFADGNAQAADPLVPDSENALTVRDNNDVDFWIWVVAKERGNEMAQRIRNEEAARTPIDMAEFLAAEGHDGRVHDGQHLINMIEEQAIEEHFVGVLKLAKINVALEIVRLERKRLVGADALIVERFYDWRKEAVETEDFSLRFGERGAFVERGIVQ